MGLKCLRWWKAKRIVSRRERLQTPLRLLLEELENRLAPVTSTFAVIGDFGDGSADEAAVANLVDSWNPQFIVTVGDNNYASTLSVATYDTNVGQFYSDYIHPYSGAYGSGATTNKFWPAIGNHDYSSTGGFSAYLGYFTLPGNERYYKFTRGEVEFFILNSDSHEPDGRSSTSIQAQWLQNALAASTATWQMVVLHHAPYSSGPSGGGTTTVRWPYEDWGADVVMTGHVHNYERLQIGDIPYFVNGLGGVSRASFSGVYPGSQVRYNAKDGAMLITASETQINYKFINVDGVVIDNYTVTLSALPVVSIAATDTSVSEEGPDNGRFTITRTGSTDAELVVNYTLSGTATNGEDYSFRNGTATIAVGAASVNVNIVPVDDGLGESDETVTATLSSSSAYQLGSAIDATVTIADNDETFFSPLIATGSTWKYLDNGSNQGTSWRQSSFNDSTWASGAAELGYGDGDEATLVGYGSDPNNRYVTTYFRKAFEVTDASEVLGLTVRLLRDDGGVVYLNGVEVFRSNMPTGTIAYTTLAASTSEGDAFFELNINPGLLVDGTNVLAVEIHQRSKSSSDISFDLELVGEFAGSPPVLPTVTLETTDGSAAEQGPDSGQFTISRTGSTAADLVVQYTISGSATNGADYSTLSGAITIPTGSSSVVLAIIPIDDAQGEEAETATVTLASSSLYTLGSEIAGTVAIADNDIQVLVAAGSTWKYLDNGSNQGTAWRQTNFNDSAWASGAAQLGYGDSDVATVVSFGPDSRNKYITTYFRLAFDVSDPAIFSALTLRLLRDDGAVVYLNGVEIVRSNMPTDTITYLTRASSTIDGSAESIFHEFDIDPSLLISGTNVLAVEIHQRDGRSSDISFDLELTGAVTT